ncbi:hypothetical protein CHLRE_09g391550v5 [Chlamydomonas reinhardtii]|uniref:Uncharacterized protein n=1 Tax=Chlamydomonas reinhardtii TaxID=3055 RepID=A0A2K3DDH1_CHLRE|nr:uncharacterized protein CHLRE_09g391550v5 [Chlamydomonas reinhardtii]PNW78575.1 hypothetical protein CHLRE_09g391550v5 [Chlamydomonas reinhardtii]
MPTEGCEDVNKARTINRCRPIPWPTKIQQAFPPQGPLLPQSPEARRGGWRPQRTKHSGIRKTRAPTHA